MITVPNFEILNNLPSTPEVNEYAILEDTHEVYQYKEETGWTKMNNDAELNVSLYDINKQVISQLPSLDTNGLATAKELITQYLIDTDNTYYMLYSNELAYFTVFKIKNTDNPEHLADIMVDECLTHLGETTQSITLTEDTQSIECWIKSNDECYVLYLFPYDGGIIECSM